MAVWTASYIEAMKTHAPTSNCAEVTEINNGMWPARKRLFCKQPVRELKLWPLSLAVKLELTVLIGCPITWAPERAE
jgi:hypothetical protein